MSVITAIQEWFASNCGDDWERDFGVQIETVGNPGWSVQINLEDTNLEHNAFDKIALRSSESDWLYCEVRAKTFRGTGDVNKLEEILQIFVTWAKSQNEDWLMPPKPLSDKELQSLEDAAFMASLGVETGPELCQTIGCTLFRISQSVMCRRHHFEMIKKRPAPIL